MKLNETLSNTMVKNSTHIEELGDMHIGTSLETPLRPDAFEKDDDLKIEMIEKHFEQIMLILGLDLEDDSLSGTPHRVAKMYVNEIFSGLNPKNEPEIKLFDNKYQYNEMLIERDIPFHSNCEHHFVPIIGKAHCAYISNGKVVGLSKINRIVHYYARRPQVQERMTMQIANHLKRVLETDSIAVVIEAEHMCVSTRGVQDQGVFTITSEYGGQFKNNPQVREEFLRHIKG